MNAFQILAAGLGKEHEQGQIYAGLSFIRTEFHDHGRWWIAYMDVYWHPTTDTYAGVTYYVPATEQQDQPSDPELVPVEKDPTPHFRIKRTPR